MRSILIVDDEKHTRDGLSAVLADSYDVFAAADADEAIKMLDAEPFDAVITDLRMAGKSGMSVIDKTISMPEKPVCIMLTAYGNMETAVEAMKHGATDFLAKPVDIDRLEKTLSDALDRRDAQKSEADIKKREHVAAVKKSHGEDAVVATKHVETGCLIATGKKMREVVDKAVQVAHSKATVMITGETGTGKELIARLIHSSSPRKDKPFLPVHCAALPANRKGKDRPQRKSKGGLFLSAMQSLQRKFRAYKSAEWNSTRESIGDFITRPILTPVRSAARARFSEKHAPTEPTAFIGYFATS